MVGRNDISELVAVEARLESVHVTANFGDVLLELGGGRLVAVSPRVLIAEQRIVELPELVLITSAAGCARGQKAPAVLAGPAQRKVVIVELQLAGLDEVFAQAGFHAGREEAAGRARKIAENQDAQRRVCI